MYAEALKTHQIVNYIKAQVDFRDFVQQPFLDEDEREVGHEVHCMLRNVEVLASGTHSVKAIARQIAVAEALERIEVTRLNKSSQASRLGLDRVKSTSGFAVGFSSESTRLRALCEGLERWAWSQWIDHGHAMNPESRSSIQLSLLGRNLARQFELVRYYSQSISVPGLGLVFHFGVTLGTCGDGIFAGSKVSLSKEDLWTHGLIEARRNLRIHQATEIEPPPTRDWYLDRVKFFAHNEGLALDQIEAATRAEWPSAELDFVRQADLGHDLFFLWRALFHDFIPWHEGPSTRFVY